MKIVSYFSQKIVEKTGKKYPNCDEQLMKHTKDTW